MKLRTTHNSIRIRIRKSELALLAEKGKIEESINFGNQVVFRFGLFIDKQMNNVEANLKDNYLLLSIPQEMAATWISSNQVGIEATNPISDTETLHLLIEKDFPCLDREEEDKSDTFWELAPAETPDKC